MNNILTSKQTEDSVSIIKSAGKVLMSYFSRLDPSQIESKKDGTKLTQADLASNDLIVRSLMELTPSFDIYSEEIQAEAGKIYQKPVWIIDPLDGTTAFIEGRDDFSILIALQDNYEVVYGMMFFPAKDQLLVAEKGKGAFLNNSAIKVSTNKELIPGNLYNRQAPAVFEPYSHKGKVDSGMAFSMIARGDYDCTVIKKGVLHDFDFAAPSIVIKEAGGKISDELGNPFRFLDPHYQPKYFIASNGVVHERVLEAVQKIQR